MLASVKPVRTARRIADPGEWLQRQVKVGFKSSVKQMLGGNKEGKKGRRVVPDPIEWMEERYLKHSKGAKVLARTRSAVAPRPALMRTLNPYSTALTVRCGLVFESGRCSRSPSSRLVDTNAYRWCGARVGRRAMNFSSTCGAGASGCTRVRAKGQRRGSNQPSVGEPARLQGVRSRIRCIRKCALAAACARSRRPCVLRASTRGAQHRCQSLGRGAVLGRAFQPPRQRRAASQQRPIVRRAPRVRKPSPHRESQRARRCKGRLTLLPLRHPCSHARPFRPTLAAASCLNARARAQQTPSPLISASDRERPEPAAPTRCARRVVLLFRRHLPTPFHDAACCLKGHTALKQASDWAAPPQPRSGFSCS